MSWLDGAHLSMDMSCEQTPEDSEEQEASHAAVHSAGVSKSWT